MTGTALKTLVEGLHALGYPARLVKADYRFGDGVRSHRLALAAFAHEPADARSACIAALESTPATPETVEACRAMGAPIVFVLSGEQVEWWSQGSAGATRQVTMPLQAFGSFLAKRKRDLAPEALYRAKTRARFERECQLSFVDVGLIPLVEAESGEQLSRLLERTFSHLRKELRLSSTTNERAQWFLKALFWLLAGKILKDKSVPPFKDLDLTRIQDVYRNIERHYGHPPTTLGRNQHEVAALREAAEEIQRFSPLTHLTTESLGYLYETGLVSEETRDLLGIHSTPGYLVDYVVGKLAPWIEAIPIDERQVLEPACGHAAFLVAVMRVLRDLLPADSASRQVRQYLRTRLHGIEIDPFAQEIALLSLTLADIPNPDGWDIRNEDMFAGDSLERLTARTTILLGNPPFEKHDARHTKASEMLARCLPRLPIGAVFGVVVPQGLLHAQGSKDVRELLARHFEMEEILLLPDKVFRESDVETAVLLGRRVDGAPRWQTRYRRVREASIDDFKRTAQATLVGTRTAPPAPPFYDLRFEEMSELWQRAARRLDDCAESGQGLSHHSKKLPRGLTVVSVREFPGSTPGFQKIGRGTMLHELPIEVHLSLDPRAIRRPQSGAVAGIPQIVLNYTPVSRGPWRLKAFLDPQGHAVTTRFHVVRPTVDLPLELFWAILNSPYANAYVFARSTKRHITSGILRDLPMPVVEREEALRVAERVREYLALARSGDGDAARATLLAIDAAVLAMYALPSRLERKLLDLFAGQQRPGVPFKFDRYFPEDFEPNLPLHLYLSEQLRHSTNERLLAMARGLTLSEGQRQGLSIAAAHFGED